MQDLGTLGGSASRAEGVSADGAVVVGLAQNAAGHRRAFRWTQDTGEMQDLGTLGGSVSAAFGVSADGTVTTGYARNADGQWRAFRWAQDDRKMRDLGTLGGSESQALGVSADGSVVVGSARNKTGEWRAYLWTYEQEMQDLNALCADLLTEGSVLTRAWAVSADGRSIVGYGYNAATKRTEAFLLRWRE